jgi:glycosyltransferase involved in cell wall biosynthesis
VSELSTTVQDQQNTLTESYRIATKLQDEKAKVEQRLQALQSERHESQQFLMKERAAYAALAAQALVAIEARRTELDNRIAGLEALIQQRDAELNHIYRSHGWRALTVYYQLRDKLLPENTKRRELAKYLWKCVGKTSRFLRGKKKESTEIGSGGDAVQSASRSSVESVGMTPVTKEENIATQDVMVVEAPYDTSGENLLQSFRTSPVEPVVKKVVVDGLNIPKNKVTVSVVIPTKNGGENFRRVLAAIANQVGFRQIEIIVVDSGSTDNTVELADQFGAKVIKILPEEFSHSYARNFGASYASGEYLLFTVQDALPPSDSWLYELFSVIEKNDVVAVSCAEFPCATTDLFYRAISWNHYNFLEIDKQDRIMRYMGSEDHLTLRKNGQLSDLACLISKKVFSKYKYKTDYAEDLDLGLRLIKDGYQIAFLGSTRIIHSHNRSAYYYLKRGYTANVFLTQIFPDYPRARNSLDRVIPDVLFTYQFIESMVEEKKWDLRFPCKTDEFSNRIIESFQTAYKAPSLISTQMVEGHLVELEFLDFLGRLVKGYPIASSDVRPGDGDLTESVNSFTKIILAYMGNSYDLVDEYIAGDFRLSLYKMFAYQCGAKLAQCCPRNDDRDRQQLEQIHGELSRGI